MTPLTKSSLPLLKLGSLLGKLYSRNQFEAVKDDLYRERERNLPKKRIKIVILFQTVVENQ